MNVLVALGGGIAALIGAAAAAQPNAQPAGTGQAGAEAAAQSCTARKFETIIRFTGANGKERQSKVKLCGTPGQTDAEWAKTLRDGADKMRANLSMPPEARQQVVAAIEAELAKVDAAPAGPKLAVAPSIAAPRSTVAPRAAPPEYSALPPFPPPPVTPPAGALSSPALATTAASTVASPPLPRPKLNLSCFSAGDIGGAGPCFAFDRETVITVQAGEPLQNTSLRFVRGGDVRADYPLPALAKGRSARFSLPRDVCKGAVGGTLTIRIVRAPAGQPAAAQVVGSEGPYNLRC